MDIVTYYIVQWIKTMMQKKDGVKTVDYKLG